MSDETRFEVIELEVEITDKQCKEGYSHQPHVWEQRFPKEGPYILERMFHQCQGRKKL